MIGDYRRGLQHNLRKKRFSPNFLDEPANLNLCCCCCWWWWWFVSCIWGSLATLRGYWLYHFYVLVRCSFILQKFLLTLSIFVFSMATMTENQFSLNAFEKLLIWKSPTEHLLQVQIWGIWFQFEGIIGHCMLHGLLVIYHIINFLANSSIVPLNPTHFWSTPPCRCSILLNGQGSSLFTPNAFNDKFLEKFQFSLGSYLTF